MVTILHFSALSLLLSSLFLFLFSIFCCSIVCRQRFFHFLSISLHLKWQTIWIRLTVDICGKKTTTKNNTNDYGLIVKSKRWFRVRHKQEKITIKRGENHRNEKWQRRIEIWRSEIERKIKQCWKFKMKMAKSKQHSKWFRLNKSDRCCQCLCVVAFFGSVGVRSRTQNLFYFNWSQTLLWIWLALHNSHSMKNLKLFQCSFSFDSFLVPFGCICCRVENPKF